MRTITARPIALLLLCAAQLAVPAWTVARHERVLAGGESFRFRCAPVDPVDPLRGRYVALRFEENAAPVEQPQAFRVGERVYVRVAAGEDGFARLTGADRARPRDVAFVRARVTGIEAGRIRVELPFNRYFVPEQLAPAIEQAYREHTRTGEPATAWAIVRVLDGTAAIEELLLGDAPAITAPGGA